MAIKKWTKTLIAFINEETKSLNFFKEYLEVNNFVYYDNADKQRKQVTDSISQFSDIKWSAIRTDEADIDLINEVSYPQNCATASAIWTRDTLSAPPTLSNNCICLPSVTRIRKAEFINANLRYLISIWNYN